MLGVHVSESNFDEQDKADLLAQLSGKEIQPLGAFENVKVLATLRIWELSQCQGEPAKWILYNCKSKLFHYVYIESLWVKLDVDAIAEMAAVVIYRIEKSKIPYYCFI